jgi:hypothetical protein
MGRWLRLVRCRVADEDRPDVHQRVLTRVGRQHTLADA